MFVFYVYFVFYVCITCCYGVSINDDDDDLCRFAILPPLLGVLVSGAVAYSVIRTQSSIVFFLIGDFLYGCTGSFCSVSMFCYAYVADRTPAERRMLRNTVLHLCMIAAVIVSMIGIGPIVRLLGVPNVVLTVNLISVVNFAYVFLVLHDEDLRVGQETTTSDVLGGQYTQDEVGNSLLESFDSATQPVADCGVPGCSVNTSGTGAHPHQPRFRHVEPRSDDDMHVGLSHSLNRDVPLSRPEPRLDRQTRTLCDGVRRVISLFLSPGRSRLRLNVLMAAFFVAVLPTFDQDLTNLYEMNRPLCWTIRQIGLFTGTKLAISALGALIITLVMKRCATDWHIAITASVAAVITYVYMFFVRDSLMMYFCKSFIRVRCHFLGFPTLPL